MKGFDFVDEKRNFFFFVILLIDLEKNEGHSFFLFFDILKHGFLLRVNFGRSKVF